MYLFGFEVVVSKSVFDILELKQWYGQKAHEKGLVQLADYLDIHALSKGYLIIFDNRKQKTWKQEQIDFEGKEIFAIWV